MMIPEERTLFERRRRRRGIEVVLEASESLSLSLRKMSSSVQKFFFSFLLTER
jgi:hypothetical protein